MAEEEAVSKKGKARKPLKPLTSNEINISAGNLANSQKGISSIISPQKIKRAVLTPSTAQNPLADELQDMQRRLEQLCIEKEKTEETLKQKEEELENQRKEQERLQKELKKLQKMKEFNPTMTFPLVKSLREEKKEKKTKSKDGAEKKKKPCTAYILWCKDHWNEVKKENPDADFKEISNILGAKWKNINAEDKKPYEEKYQQDKEAYLQIVGKAKRENEAMKLLEEEQMQKTAMELLEQYLQFKQESDKEGKKKRKEKDPLKPKKPMSAFFLFSRDCRATLLQGSKNAIEIAKIAGEQWKDMTEEKRAPYEEDAMREKEVYQQQMEAYKLKKLEEALILEREETEQTKVVKQEALQLLKKKERAADVIKRTKEISQKKKKQKEGENAADPNKPRKPASSFLLFSKEARKQLLLEQQDISNSTLTAMVSVKWKELSEAEKLILNEKAAKSMAAYKREMEEYRSSAGAKNDITNCVS